MLDHTKLMWLSIALNLLLFMDKWDDQVFMLRFVRLTVLTINLVIYILLQLYLHSPDQINNKIACQVSTWNASIISVQQSVTHFETV